MEYVEHGDLGRYISQYGGTSKARSEVGEITAQILEGLVVLHERDICHRDLKPQVHHRVPEKKNFFFFRKIQLTNFIQNILIACPSPIWVKITDFGVSKRGIGTSFNTNCGTVYYQAPEQMGILPKKFRTKDSYTKVVDIWALGTVVHEILTSEIPFLEIEEEEDDITFISGIPTNVMSMIDMGLLMNYCNGLETFPVASLHRNGVSAEGIDFVKSLMVVNPKDRVSAADALKSPWIVRYNPAAADSPTVDSEPAERSHLRMNQFRLLDFCRSPQVATRVSIVDGGPKLGNILSSPGATMVWSLRCAAAEEEGYVEIEKIQLKAAGDSDFEPTGYTVSDGAIGNGLLPSTVKNSRVAMIDLLLDHGADATATAEDAGMRELYDAARRCRSCRSCSSTDHNITQNPTPPTPPTVFGVFDGEAVASLVGERRRQFIEDANEIIQTAIRGSVPYANCNQMLVEFCRSNGLVGEVPTHYGDGYSHWCKLGENAALPPLERLQSWKNAVEARGTSEHWGKLVVRAFADLLASLS